ncbi:MAG: hypothetical protein ACSLEX_02475 [Minisyncoccota bacterium]
MNARLLVSFLRRNIYTMILFGIFGALISFTGLIIIEKSFQSRMDFLIVQSNSQGQDFYTQFKSSEYLGKVLSEALYSEKFINTVIETGKVNNEFLPFDKTDRLKTWDKMVQVQKSLELGIISVTVKHTSEREATRIVTAISEVLTQKNALFRGGDVNSVEVRILSGPINIQNPTVSMMFATALAGFFAGLFFSGSWILTRYKKQISEKNENIVLHDTL